MKRILMSLLALSLLCTTANAQSFLEKLGERAKKAVEENVGNKVEKGVNDILDGKVFNKGKKDNKQAGEEASKPAAEATVAAGWTCEECGREGNTGKFCEECGAKQPGAASAAPAPKPEPKKQTASNYAKSDFVPGDEIIFEDTFENEQLGEFPAQWDLMDGYAEVGEVDGRKVIAFTDNGVGELRPLMKDQEHFLSDVFTLEFDVYAEVGEDLGGESLEIAFGNPDLDNWNGRVIYVEYQYRDDGSSTFMWSAQKPNGGNDNVGQKLLNLYAEDTPLREGWNHIAFSFNKRAFKAYINGVRVINVPQAKVPSWFWFNHGGVYKYACISNVRVAKGAVPLYDRLMNDGKIITYAITFETGKADIKPESMVEINRIAKLMQENPGLNFEVQGHCDATGSDKVNDPLSQKRAEAIVDALVELDIARARLTPVGKGSHDPIATNSTDEGRAKNRRVEFVKK